MLLSLLCVVWEAGIAVVRKRAGFKRTKLPNLPKRVRAECFRHRDPLDQYIPVIDTFEHPIVHVRACNVRHVVFRSRVIAAELRDAAQRAKSLSNDEV